MVAGFAPRLFIPSILHDCASLNETITIYHYNQNHQIGHISASSIITLLMGGMPKVSTTRSSPSPSIGDPSTSVHDLHHQGAPSATNLLQLVTMPNLHPRYSIGCVPIILTLIPLGTIGGQTPYSSAIEFRVHYLWDELAHGVEILESELHPSTGYPIGLEALEALISKPDYSDLHPFDIPFEESYGLAQWYLSELEEAILLFFIEEFIHTIVEQ
eukprot:Gb_32781 [translate_table: standard]